MDPLSDVLATIFSPPSGFGGLKAGDDWAVRFPAQDYIKVNAIVLGACWLSVEGRDDPIALQQGDCFLMPRGRAAVVGSDVSLPAMAAETLFAGAGNRIARCGPREDCFLIGGRFSVSREADLIIDSLPTPLVIRRDSEQAGVLQWALQQMVLELSTPGPGSALAAQSLGQLMLVQVLRIHLQQEADMGPGVLSALSEPGIGAAVRGIHADPARRWSVSDLAREAGLSRSTFALRFREVAGVPPLDYVSRWRMRLAARSLRSGQGTISSIGQSLGYSSDSAFSSAFKRVMKCSPKAYRGRQAG